MRRRRDLRRYEHAVSRYRHSDGSPRIRQRTDQPQFLRLRRRGRVLRLRLRMHGIKNSARGDSSTGSELKAVEEACREASRAVEPCALCGPEKKLNYRN